MYRNGGEVPIENNVNTQFTIFSNDNLNSFEQFIKNINNMICTYNNKFKKYTDKIEKMWVNKYYKKNGGLQQKKSKHT